MKVNFGQCFKAFLHQNSLTQIQAAERLGFSQAQISRLCTQVHIPRPHVLAHLALKLGVSESELLGQAPATTHSVKMVGEAEFPPDPWPAWVRNLRGRYQAADEATQAVMAADIRRLWPRPVAEKILAWLRTDPTP